MIIALRTDKPEAELYLYKDKQLVDELRWQAHRQLSDTLLSQLQSMLEANQATLSDLTGLVVYSGPGSFTGLRIGITVANGLAYALGIPISGAISDNWQLDGLQLLKQTSLGEFVTPHYGAAPNITQPRK